MSEYVMVPRELTHEMRMAFTKAEMASATPGMFWNDLLAAAPTPPAFDDLPDTAVAAWVERHDLEGALGKKTDARAAFDEARTAHLIDTPQPAAAGSDLDEECQIHRHAAFELSSILAVNPFFEVTEDGGTEAAWANIVEAVRKLAAAAPREPAPAVEKIASFLKERDEALVPGEATDEERIASAQVIAEMFSGWSPAAPAVDAELQRDAERYRWLREQMEFENDSDPEGGAWYSSAFFKDSAIHAPRSPYYQCVEEVIDAAIQARRQQGGE